MIETSGLAVALALAASAAPLTPTASGGRWILTCNMASAHEGSSSPNARRLFRMGRQLFQEWRPAENRFGRNLCRAHACTSTPGSLEGTIQSASVSLTISLDPAAGRAIWRTAGASGLKTPSGPCSVEADTGRHGPPPAP